jgi:hypothetical protein
VAKKSQSWERIDNMLGLKNGEQFKVGQELTFERPSDFFDQQPIRTTLKIMRTTKKGHVWAKHIRLYDPDDVEVVEKDDGSNQL